MTLTSSRARKTQEVSQSDQRAIGPSTESRKPSKYTTKRKYARDQWFINWMCLVGKIVQGRPLKWVGASTLVPQTPLPYYALRHSIPSVTKDWPLIVRICTASSCYLPWNSSGRRSDTWIQSARTGWASAGSDQSHTRRTSNHSLSTIKMPSDKQTLCNVVSFCASW